MYADPVVRQTFVCANQIPCESFPQSVIALDPDTDQYYVLTPKPYNRLSSTVRTHWTSNCY